MERNKRILIVDDQQDLREQLAKLLLRAGKKNETFSLVQQMRSKLLGERGEPEADIAAGFEEPSYTVDVAGQGEAAFEMVKKANENNNNYAVMFLDMRMPPGWDGLQTAKAVRDIDKNIEIVIMTAYADHDQKQIADTVGTPEKLLYIKKPFQAEEIYQLALSLTSKWSLEFTEKQRKKWLEVLLRGMCKIKSPSISESGNIYQTALKSFMDFTGAKKGIIAAWNESEKKWIIESVFEIERHEAEKFISEKSSFLFESRTTQHFEDKYLLPMRKDVFFAVAVLYEVKTKSDPEWYKLLSLLVMTATEVLSNAVFMNDYLEKEKSSAIGLAIDKISHQSKNMLNQILGYASTLKELAGNAKSAEITEKMLGSGRTMLRMFQNLLFYNQNEPMPLQDCDLVQIINSGYESVVKPADKVEKIMNGPKEFKIKANPESLQVVFANLASNSMASASEANIGNLKLAVTIKEENGDVTVVFEDNGPGIPENIRKTLFNPFSGSGKSVGTGLGLPIVRQILARHNALIIYDENFKSGARFVITFKKPRD